MFELWRFQMLATKRTGTKDGSSFIANAAGCGALKIVCYFTLIIFNAYFRPFSGCPFPIDNFRLTRALRQVTTLRRAWLLSRITVGVSDLCLKFTRQCSVNGDTTDLTLLYLLSPASGGARLPFRGKPLYTRLKCCCKYLVSCTKNLL
jgi:hypothetical protein